MASGVQKSLVPGSFLKSETHVKIKPTKLDGAMLHAAEELRAECRLKLDSFLGAAHLNLHGGNDQNLLGLKTLSKDGRRGCNCA